MGIPAEFLRKYACAFHVGNAGEGAWVMAPFRLAALLAHQCLPFPPAHRRLYLYNGQGRVNAEERPGKIVKPETPDLKFAAMSEA